MPQPLSKVRSDAIVDDKDALLRRPQLAALVCQTICEWSWTEVNLARLLAAILATESDAVSAGYLAISSDEVRRVFLTEVGNATLKGDDLIAFVDVMAAVRPARDRRNEFAHHIWLTSDALPDALLLFDSRLQSKIASLVTHVAQSKCAADGRMINPETALKLAGISQDQKSKIMVYREQDLKDSLALCREARQCINLLALTLQQSLDTQLGRMLRAMPTRQTLYELPLMKRVLQQKSMKRPGGQPPQSPGGG